MICEQHFAGIKFTWEATWLTDGSAIMPFKHSLKSFSTDRLWVYNAEIFFVASFDHIKSAVRRTKLNLKKTLPEAQRTQGIEFITWVNLSTRIIWNWFQWNFLNWLQILSRDGATCIGCQFGHWVHHLLWFQIWPPDGANCISSIFDHQMASLALVANMATRWHHLHY